MNKTIYALVAALVLPVHSYADLSKDLAMGKSLQKASAVALQAGHRPYLVVDQLLAADVDLFSATEAVVAVAPDSAKGLVRKLVGSNPDSSGAIVLAAMNQLPDSMETEIVRAAIEGGADPAQVLEATSAVRPQIEVSRGVLADMESGVDLQQAMRNALEAGHSPESVIEQFMAAGVDSFSVTEAIVAIIPEKSQSLVDGLVRRYPASSGAIVLAAMNSLPYADEAGIVQAAIAAGADPSEVSTATASGRPQRWAQLHEALSAGVSPKSAAQDVIALGQPAEDVMVWMLEAGVSPFVATEAVISQAPELATSIVKAAVRKVPEASEAIVSAAMNHLPDNMEEAITQAAIEGGGEPGKR